MKNYRSLLATVLLTMTSMTFAQSEIGECGIDSSTAPASTLEAMFTFDGVEFSEHELPTAMQQALFDARLKHYKAQLQIIDTALLEVELDQRSLSSGKPIQTLVEELFAVRSPEENDITSFYEEYKERIPYPLEQVRDQIVQMLLQQKIQAKQQTFLASIKKEKNFSVSLTKPVAPYALVDTDDFPSKGPADAKVTLIEFADYQCPHCRSAASAVRKVAEQFPNDLRVVFMDFPINPSGISRIIAQGAACADKQGKFWAYHDLAFERQSVLSADSPIQLAAELGLDSDEFQSCMASDFALERVARSEGESQRLGLSGTPTFFLNGRRLHLHDIESGLIDEIKNEINGSSKS